MNGWEKTRILTSILATILIPSFLGFVGHSYTAALKEREMEGKFVELAIDILRETPSPDKEPLRGWATKVIDQYSGVPLAEAREALKKSTPLPPALGLCLEWGNDPETGKRKCLRSALIGSGSIAESLKLPAGKEVPAKSKLKGIDFGIQRSN